MDDVEERRQPVDVVQFARQRRGQVEAEAIHMHLLHPVAQAVHDQLQHLRMAHVQAVAGARVIHVVARIVRHQAVVGRVVDAAEAQHRAHVIAFGRVVVHHVENHLDAFAVQRLHHALELGHLAARVAGAGIARIRREEVGGVVAPVIRQPFVDQALVVQKVVHRHQLDGRDAELLQIRDARLGRQSRIGAAQVLRHVRMQLGEAFDVDFVDDGVAQRNLGASGPVPNRSTD